MMRFLRDPLVHFFLLAAAIFGLYSVLDDSPPPVAANALIITEDDARQLVAGFEATWQRPPTVEELDYMIASRVREEVYVREALALGLDGGDAVIRQRLQTKMEFLTESGAEALEPDDATLQAHLEAYPDRFAQSALVAFEQVLLAEGTTPDEAAAIAARMNLGAAPGDAAQATLLPPDFPLSPVQVVDGSFGAGFFDELGTLPLGVWAGPVETPLGEHLVRVTERREARVPPLSEIRERVLRDWRAGLSDRLREDRYQALLSRYEVVRPDAAQVLAP